MKKIAILGSDNYFVNIVKSAQEEGLHTIVCDGMTDTPAKQICDEVIDVDLFDIKKVENILKNKEIDGIFSSFSEVLVEPYINLANKLGLPSPIKINNLDVVKNKVTMKNVFRKNELNVVDYELIEGIEDIDKLDRFKFPIVLKPIDSSGSKGIYFVKSRKELEVYIDKAISFSEKKQAIVEEFYESDEVQGLAWVNNGECHLLYIGDRELVEIHRGRPGKPRKLVYPSKYCYQYEDQFIEIYKKIAKSFEVDNGPIYAQLLIGKEGIKVNEAMTRLPGGCDYLALSKCIDIDIGKLVCKFSVGNHIDFENIKKTKLRLDKCVYIIPIYVKGGEIDKIQGIDKIKELNAVVEVFIYAKKGMIIKETGDMKQDVGRIFCVSNNIFDANQVEKFIKDNLAILDNNGNNMIENM